MFKKTVSIVIVSVLAISIGAVSVFADVDVTIPEDAVNYTVNRLFYLDPDNPSQDTSLLIQVQVNVLQPVYKDTIYRVDSTNNKYMYTYDQQYVVNIVINNNCDHDINLHNTGFIDLKIVSTQPSITSSYAGTTFSNLSSNVNSISLQTNSSINQLLKVYLSDEYYNNYRIVLPKLSKTVVSFTVHQDIYVLSSYNAVVPTNRVISSITVYPDLDDYIYISEYPSLVTYYQIDQILQAYRDNVQGSEELNSDIAANDEKLDNIHQNEAQWYSQNSQAIESTGLSNFEFSTDQSSALTGVFSLFQRLWTALGDYTFVVTFTLMMSFATFFLRHNPVKKTSGNNYLRNYNKGGESHGSSAG